jgi:nucleotide-binding universal stress UspA family protein
LIAPRRYRPIQRVLVAYGGKDLGGLALDTGQEVARTLGLPLGVLTVADRPEAATLIQSRARARLGEAASTTRFSVNVGDPATVITDCGDQDTLIVMGAYGHSRLYHVMLGSVTEQVVRFARSPVLLSAKPGTERA